MKKFLLVILSSIMCLSLLAQEVEKNRLLVHDKMGDVKGYVLDRVDYIEFETVEGEVAANVEVLEVTLDKLLLSVQRTVSCQGFKLSCFPTVAISSYSDDVLASLVDKDSPNVYDKDFESAEMTGMVFDPNTEYSIVTVGIDMYGVLCDVRKVSFTTPSKPIVGNPYVEIEEIDVQRYQFTVGFKPNEDVLKYSVIAAEKGTLQQQYEMFAPMFGYANFGQMIEGWGVQFDVDTTFTWKQMNPATEYEVMVQAWDVDGTMAEHQVYNLSTQALGGEGTAEVSITLGDYVMADWGGEMLPSQFITFTPNDQASAYRMSVYLAENYDGEAEAIKADLCSEPPMPMTGWFQYETITTDYQINPNTECVAIAAAKNINGEWGPVTELRFTTPAETVAAGMAPSKVIAKRKLSGKSLRQAGVLPVIKQQGQISLTAR